MRDDVWSAEWALLDLLFRKANDAFLCKVVCGLVVWEHRSTSKQMEVWTNTLVWDDTSDDSDSIKHVSSEKTGYNHDCCCKTLLDALW